MRTFIFILALLPFNLQAWCGYINLSASYSVPCCGSMVPLSWTYPYTASSWAFNTTIPPGTYVYVTDIIFQSKNVRHPNTGTRSSYLVLNSLITVADHMGGQVHLNAPLIVGPGYAFGGAFINQSPEVQNMVAIVTGYAWDSIDCRDKFK